MTPEEADRKVREARAEFEEALDRLIPETLERWRLWGYRREYMTMVMPLPQLTELMFALAERRRLNQ